ncbi:MAG: hypothetical protein KGI98_15945 [Euryarchaeota archaeon]|nr:hypothetical protein [Euryarchaeota archaeon]
MTSLSARLGLDADAVSLPEGFEDKLAAAESALTSSGKVQAMLQSYINQASSRMKSGLSPAYTSAARDAFDSLASARDYLKLITPKVAVAVTLGRAALNSVPLGQPAVDAAVSRFDAIYGQAHSMLVVAHDKAASAIKKAVDSEKVGSDERVTPKKLVQAAEESASEAGSLVVRGAQRTGQAVISAGQGAASLAPLARYALPIGLIFVGLYLWTALPRARFE